MSFLDYEGLQYFWEKVLEKSGKGYVTPKMFGAKGDGVTDDTAAVQKAINESNFIYFDDGTYKVKGLSISGTKHVIGVNATIKNSQTINVTNFSGCIRNLTFISAYDIQISNSKNFDISNVKLENQIHGMFIEGCEGFVLDNIISKNQVNYNTYISNSKNFRVNGTFTGKVAFHNLGLCNCENALVKKSLFSGAAEFGCSFFNCKNCTMDDNVSYDTFKEAYQLQGSSHCKIINNYCYWKETNYVGTDYGISVYSPSQNEPCIENLIANNTIELSAKSGFNVTGAWCKNNTFENNTLTNVNYISSNVNYAISVESDSVIKGNKISTKNGVGNVRETGGNIYINNYFATVLNDVLSNDSLIKNNHNLKGISIGYLPIQTANNDGNFTTSDFEVYDNLGEVTCKLMLRITKRGTGRIVISLPYVKNTVSYITALGRIYETGKYVTFYRQGAKDVILATIDGSEGAGETGQTMEILIKYRAD